NRDIQERLDSLFEADEYLYRVSALRKEPKDFSYQELRREVARRKLFQPLHEFATTFLEKADISYGQNIATVFVSKRLRVPGEVGHMNVNADVTQRYKTRRLSLNVRLTALWRGLDNVVCFQ
ncbi:MAG TPA: hypothetical protein VE641_16425, partial [Chthoniobacterales bacterium]|nr:hypothetical protein [Chthoniobacterales bacterium]